MAKSGLLTAREKQLWLAVKRLSDTALAAVASDIEVETGLSGADFGILSRIEDLGQGQLLQADLLASLGWEKSRLSHQLARMERRDLVRRGRSTTGGVSVTLLPDGRTQIEHARPIHAVAVRRHVLRYLTPDEAEALLSFTSRIEAQADHVDTSKRSTSRK